VTVNFSLDWRDVCSHTQRSVRGQSETYIVEAWIFRRLDIIVGTCSDYTNTKIYRVQLSSWTVIGHSQM
jgi:hypothetical protein